MRQLVAFLVAAATVLLGCGRKPVPWKKPTPADIAAALELISPELRCEPTPLPDEQNALVVWRRASEKLVSCDNDDILGRAVSAALNADRHESILDVDIRMKADMWLAANEEALALVDDGLELGACRFEIVPGERHDMSVPQAFNTITDIRRVRALLRAADGDIAGACDELSKVFRACGLIAAGGGTTLYYYHALGQRMSARRTIRQIAELGASGEEVLERLLETLDTRENMDRDLAESLRVDLALIAAELHANPGRAYLWSWPGPIILDDVSDFLKTATDIFGKTVWSVGRRWAERRTKAGSQLSPLVEEWREFQSDTIKDMLSGDGKERLQLRAKVLAASGGALYAAANIHQAEAWLSIHFRDTEDVVATRTALALRLFEMRKGRLPGKLDELVTAGILDSIPSDHFADKPLRYSHERRRVWSVGPDERDDGGRDEPGSWNGKDYCLRVPGAGAP